APEPAPAAGERDRRHGAREEGRDDPTIGAPTEDGQGEVPRSLVSHAKTAHERRRESESFGPPIDGRPAPMHDDETMAAVGETDQRIDRGIVGRGRGPWARSDPD